MKNLRLLVIRIIYELLEVTLSDCEASEVAEAFGSPSWSFTTSLVLYGIRIGASMH